MALRKRRWALLALLGLLLQPAVAQAQEAVKLPGAYGFDCEAGYQHWNKSWGEDKKKWCCAYVKRGCPGDSPDLFQCNVGLDHWHTGWSQAKKDWCCENKDEGCKYECRRDPRVRYDSVVSRWCCKASPPLGCGPPERFDSEHFDCARGLAWVESWPDRKKAWCCRHENVGCADRGPGKMDGCSEDLDNEGSWPWLKSCFCCQLYGVGCSNLQKVVEGGRRLEEEDEEGPPDRDMPSWVLQLVGGRKGIEEACSSKPEVDFGKHLITEHSLRDFSVEQAPARRPTAAAVAAAALLLALLLLAAHVAALRRTRGSYGGYTCCQSGGATTVQA